MDEGVWTAGLLFQSVVRARRAALVESLEVHGMDDLTALLPWLWGAAGPEPDPVAGEQLLRVCRVVDQRMLAGFSVEDRALLCALLRRVLQNLGGGRDLAD